MANAAAGTTDVAQAILQTKLQTLQNAPSNVRSNLANHQPADAHPFLVNSAFDPYPATGKPRSAVPVLPSPSRHGRCHHIVGD